MVQLNSYYLSEVHYLESTAIMADNLCLKIFHHIIMLLHCNHFILSLLIDIYIAKTPKNQITVTICISLMCVDLPAPTNVKAEVLTSNTVEVAWDQSSEVTSYFVSCISTASYAGGKNAIVHGDNTSCTFINLVENTPYDITVQSLTRDGRKGDHSAEVSVITQKAGT